jgi:branched-chain amino acid transport system permease protein
MYGELYPRNFVPITALMAAGLVLPFLLPAYFLYLGNTLMMYAVLAIGLDLLLGWSGQFAFAHIAFFGVGIYGTALLQARFGIPFVVGLPVAATLAGLIGWLIAIPSTRLRTVYLALATYAFAECAQWAFRTWDAVTGGSDGLRITPPSVLGQVTGTDASAFPVVAIILSLMLLATLYLTKSKLGRHLCAIRDSEHVAAASGIDVTRVKIVAFTLSAVYAGIAGGMYTLFQSFVNPDVLGVTQLVLVLTMVVVGGPGSITGVLLGVVLIGLLPEVLRAAPRGLLVWQEFFYGLILILAVMFMPRGLWGVVEAWLPGARTRARRQQPALSAAADAPLDSKVSQQCARSSPSAT